MRLRPALLVGSIVFAAGCAPPPAAHRPPRAAPAAPAAPADLPETAPVAPAAAPVPPVDARVARLVRFIKLWGTVRYHHPAFVQRDIDWDTPFVKALPKVEAAASDDEEAAAIGEMLRALGDPATRVVKRPKAPAEGPKLEMKRLEGDMLVVTLASADRAAFEALRRELGEALPKAKGLVVDLRAMIFTPGDWPAGAFFEWLTPKLITRAFAAPEERVLMRRGYPTDSRWGGPYSAFFEVSVPSLVKPEKGPGVPPRLAVVVGRESELPANVLSLQREAGAVVVAEGKLSEAFLPVTATRPYALGGEYIAAVRASELPSLEPARADAEVERAPGGRDAALETALRLLKRPPPRATAPTRRAEAASYHRVDPKYEATPYPDRAHRLLALARLWNVLDLYWPYKRLLGPGAWDTALALSLPAFEAARDEREYVLAVAALAARTSDSHVDLAGGLADRMFDGNSTPPVEVQRVEGRPVVTRVFDAAKASGVAVGDVVLASDGEPFEARVARLKPYVAGSTPWHQAYRTDALALSGAMGKTVALTLEGEGGRRKEVRLPRSDDDWTKAEPAYRLLEGGVGYVDLVRFNFNELDAMLAALGSAPAIVFDLRGRPHYLAHKLAARFNVRRAPYGALYQRPLAGPHWSDEDVVRHSFASLIPLADGPLYTGKTVLLTDERAYSLAEFDAMALVAATGMRVVGSPTAGVNGDLTSVCLPGGLCVSFSGAEVLFADGAQLQRVGVRPDIAARPTLRGLREGRDEVLERALRLLREGR